MDKVLCKVDWLILIWASLCFPARLHTALAELKAHWPAILAKQPSVEGVGGGEGKENTEQAEDKFSTSETVGAVRSIIYSLCVNTGNTHQVDRGSQERKTGSGKTRSWWKIVDGSKHFPQALPPPPPPYTVPNADTIYTTVLCLACCISVALACVEKESHLKR